DRALARNADTTFQNAVARIKKDAEKAAQSSNSDELKTATTHLQSEFQTALDALNKRRADLDKEIAALLAVVRGHYVLRAPLAETVSKTKRELEAGLPGLDNNNVGAAAQRLETIRADLCRDVVAAGTEWVRQVGSIAEGLDLLKPLGSSAIADLKTHWTTSQNAADSAVQQLVNDPTCALNNLQAVLLALPVDANRLLNL